MTRGRLTTAGLALSLALGLSGALAGCGSGDAPDGAPDGAGAPASPAATAGAVPGHPPGATRAAHLPEWELVPPGLAVPRDDFATAAVDGRIWMFGGMTGDRGTRLRSIEVLDTRTGEVTTSEHRLPIGLASFEGVAVGDEVLLFGGLDRRSRASDFAAAFDTTTGRWRRLPPMPVARYSHTVTLHEGKVYVIGGEGGAGPVGRVDVYDPGSGTWSTTSAPMPHARGSHDAVSADGRIFVLGGWIDAGPSDLVQSLDPATGRWRTLAPLPEPVSRGGVTVLDGRLWLSLHEFSYVHDLGSSGGWEPANPLVVPRHGLGYVAVGRSIWAIGGCTESPLRDVRTIDVLRL